MKPKCKQESWCYTAGKKSARQRVRRATSKGRRRAEKKMALSEYVNMKKE